VTGLTTTELVADFHGTHARLRSSRPVEWSEELGGWLVTSRELVVAVLRDPHSFTVDDPRFSTQRVIGPSMLSLDGPEHTRHRQPFESAFRRGDPAVLRARMTAMADRLVKAVAANGHTDLRLSVAAPLAVSVMVDALGLVNVDDAELLSWYSLIVDATVRTSLGEERAHTASGAMASLRAAVERSVDASRLLRQATSDLSLDEVVSNVAVLLFGGVETSEAMTANAFVHLLTVPTLLERLLDDGSLVAAFVEESVRIEPAAAQLDRYATVEVELGGTLIRSGDFVMCSVASGNRDEAFFDRPDTFDLDRANARSNLSFAQGPHACLATHVAKAETEAAITAALRALTNLRWDGAPPEIAGIVFRKAVSVPVSWTT
jgi:cytochrome P450